MERPVLGSNCLGHTRHVSATPFPGGRFSSFVSYCIKSILRNGRSLCYGGMRSSRPTRYMIAYILQSNMINNIVGRGDLTPPYVNSYATFIP